MLQVGKAAGGDVPAHNPAGAALRVHAVGRVSRLGILPPLQVLINHTTCQPSWPGV
jgi:hypothetical protein